jgi:hypothetical protein
MVVFPIKLPRRTARRFKGLAKIYDLPPSAFGRDLIEAVVGGNQTVLLEFVGKLMEAMKKYETKPVVLEGDDPGLFAPVKGTKTR